MMMFTIEDYDEYANIMEFRGDPCNEEDDYLVYFSLCLDPVHKYSMTDDMTKDEKRKVREYIFNTLEKVFGKNIIVALGDLDEE